MSERLQRIFADNVRMLMSDRGWSQGELARRIEVTPSYVSQLLSGHRRPGLDSLELIGKAFSVDPSDLLKKLSPQSMDSP